ncbi:MAG: tRNA (N(6)-L-threonylcarbamoyladenosine(37)-C(2))-methylthiotransferase MtaB [Rhodospirillaceae bacterium]|jgi:threonylcarbamoyladenosine tRNA methylthiotransferase MtaB|nr:tRNA (N(6)-L-threonylcarbamoyladenosine(37)-C(2))-methylthiotransferase MtaB [Rhodospirillaceae bacterium]MBT5458331.1 tRNA (N(6)-L-threonylcarbamoyladenosine(37)-C(2))-methylthiotransferase MtaB [Rhodospirillaceae bacterium]
MSAPHIQTFGCRLNAYESEVIRGHVAKAGLSDVVVINTCAVTGEAERQARQAIRRARRASPDAHIVVTGCAAQIDPDGYAAMQEVDTVLGNSEKLAAESWSGLADGTAGTERVQVNDIMSVRETASHMIGGFDGKSRAFVQVQQGCDHRCTFCIIPFGRGPSRSVPVAEIVRQVRTLVDNGYREIVLTGVDLTDYGTDLPGRPSLGSLAGRLLAHVPDLPRLRLSSLDPVEVDDALLALIANEPRLLPFFHLSIQAGDDMILKRMKRRHSRADALAICDRIRALRPDATFGADLIAGFPTETDSMFENSLKLVDEAGLSHLHVFPYSSREGTPAARMPQLPVPIRRERAARLRAAGEAQMHRIMEQRIGQTVSVLIEKDRTGRCEHYLPVSLDGDIPPGAITAATVTGREDNRLKATLLA